MAAAPVRCPEYYGVTSIATGSTGQPLFYVSFPQLSRLLSFVLRVVPIHVFVSFL